MANNAQRGGQKKKKKKKKKKVKNKGEEDIQCTLPSLESSIAASSLRATGRESDVRTAAVANSESLNDTNFVDAFVTLKGCYVAWGNKDGSGFERNLGGEWAIECYPFDEEDWGGAAASDVPDFSIDPETHVLSVINASSTRKSYFLSLVREFLPVYGSDGKCLTEGTFTLQRDAPFEACVTLIVVLNPRTAIDACTLSASRPADTNCIEDAGGVPSFYSDIKDAPDVTADVNVSMPLPVIGFPLLPGEGRPLNTRFLCTQGHCGKFTHFYPGTVHAVDFQCPVGTPVVAVGDGRVVDVRKTSTASGIHAANLFRWNSIMIEIERDTPLYVEYVHIKDAFVSVGDRVVSGDVIASSGSVGFSPSPHLHIQVHMSPDPSSPTVPVAFANRRCLDVYDVPIAGSWY